MTPDRGRIVWVNFNPQKGHEQAGRRPALVISPAAYNGVSNCILVCPITSNTTPWPWKVMLPDSCDITGAVLVDQVKSIDAEARKVETTGQVVDQAIVDDVLARLATLTG
ncbi:type II toxin-antitoxin system PemK/MazF family toxin [Ruegeria atlantica]|uniref:type II toxin-antitoxin system PemK/MazF family toxin n=1 Tax=Ruegeria atlantica TaxID=81569 RepID=UPI00147CE5AC|nr:type II toxin-antitoxin system PemK/MazF family toxin [Ruegeria atlantica]